MTQLEKQKMMFNKNENLYFINIFLIIKYWKYAIKYITDTKITLFSSCHADLSFCNLWK